MERILQSLLVSLLAMPLPAACAIEVTPATGSGDALTLAGALVDTGSPITLNSANFLIDLVGGGTAESEIRSISSFTSGNVGGQLPATNWLNPNESLSYAGGIGLSAGVCLCTGMITDADSDGANAAAGSGVGVEGPNNGFPLSAFFNPPPTQSQLPLNAGEASFIANKPRDRDFALVKTVDANNEGDAAVLQFQVSVSAPGFLRISFVFASDEYPFWLNVGQFDVNDSMAIFIRHDNHSNPSFENIALLKKPSLPAGPMSLRELRDCGPIMFRSNQVVPAPDDDLIPAKQVFDFPTSEHGFDTNSDNFNRPDDGVPYYNHEFAGFSKRLTRETPLPLAPGLYTIKIVVQDVFDKKVDSAIFLETASLKLFPLRQGDYNGNGVVDAADYVVWRDNQCSPCTSAPTFYQGDGNGDGEVDGADYTLWYANFGLTGNKDFCSDFNRDGAVNYGDGNLLAEYINQLEHCASRFEGDANGDGAVDDCDDEIFMTEMNSQTPLRPCACEQEFAGGGNDLFALTPGELAELKKQIPASADLDGDGDVDAADIAQVDAAIYGAFAKLKTAKNAATASANAGPQPAPAEPQPDLAPASGNFGPAAATDRSPDPELDPVPAPRSFPPGFPVPPNAPLPMPRR